MFCPQDFEKVEERVDKILTQYRESPKLLHVIRTYLRQVELLMQGLCSLPEQFDLTTAVGEQLSIVGRRMGFPRSHCVCTTQPVFGFDCETEEDLPVDGFCAEVTWVDCSDIGVSYVTIEDDDLYRKFLNARRYQITQRFDKPSFEEAIRCLWGEQSMIMDARNGEIVVGVGRQLSLSEQAVVQLYPRVLPTPLGVRIKLHFGSLRVFGFGDGWGGFCDGEASDGAPIQTEDLLSILTEWDEPLLADNIGLDSDWLCAVDVKPYDC